MNSISDNLYTEYNKGHDYKIDDIIHKDINLK